MIGETIEKIAARGTVSEATDRLVDAIGHSGATVFARVNHGAGAASVGMDLADAELVIFGSPKLGTPAMQQDIRAGLVLPLRILVCADSKGQTSVCYERVDAMFGDLDIAADAPFREAIAGAIAKFATAAAAG